MIIAPLKNAVKILSSPEREFSSLNRRTLEEVIGDYLRLLLGVSIAVGIVVFIYSLLKAVYYDLFLTVDINYWNMVNYSGGTSTSLVFLYIFAGTFGLFFASWPLKLFFRKMRYVEFLKLLFYSASPFLLFGWIPLNPIPLVVWTIFLLYLGAKHYKSDQIKVDSIRKRD